MPPSPHPARRTISARRLTGIGLYLIAVLALFEVGSRVVLSLPRFAAPGDRSAAAVWRAAWMERHERVAVYYGFDVYDPTLGWALRPGLRGDSTFGEASLSSNSVGMRGRREFTLERLPGRPRIALLGDSFTFGDEVSDEETWGARLQERLPETEVLNFGVHGYGHDQILLDFIERAFRYHPDVVVVGFVRDDMYRNLLDFRDYAKPRMVLTGRGLDVRNVPVPSPSAVVRRYRLGPRLADLLAIVRQGLAWRTGANRERMEALTEAILDRLVDEAAEAGAVVVLAYLPHSEELAFPELDLPEHRFFAAYCEDRAAFCLDLRPLFLRRMAAGEPIKVPGHWHADGHALVAEGVADYLQRRGLVGGGVG